MCQSLLREEFKIDGQTKDSRQHRATRTPVQIGRNHTM